MDEARRMLLSDGYTSLSMRKLAKSVGCTATSIYLYFSNKDALIHALIDEGMEGLRVALESALADATTAKRRLEAVCRAYLDFGISNPEYYEAMFMLHPKRMARYPAEKYRLARRNLDLFRAALASVLKRPLDDEKLKIPATVMWTSLHGTVSLLIAQRVDARLSRDDLLNQAVAQALAILPTIRQSK
jgi:AcrR family transcriptional regulator